VPNEQPSHQQTAAAWGFGHIALCAFPTLFDRHQRPLRSYLSFKFTLGPAHWSRELLPPARQKRAPLTHNLFAPDPPHTHDTEIATYDPHNTMAPPPPATLPIGQRLAALAQTLQFAWFAGHVTLLLSTFRYSFSYVTFNTASRWAKFSYRTAFLSACVTYGIVVYKAYRARVRQGKQGGVLTLATDENVQYLSKSSRSHPS
jgi:hypothetical protein